MKNIDTIINQVKELPTLPTIYSNLLDVMANPRSTVNDVADIIVRDQAASVKILKAVNSSIYSLQVRVETISQAIFHLGFNEVKNLVITLSVIKMFSKAQSLPSLSITDLWKHSIGTGVITRHLGKIAGTVNIENYFLAGVIHDIGKLFFLQYFYNDYANVLKYVLENDCSLFEAEKKILGITHTVVGELLADQWKLPVSIKHPISFHESGSSASKTDLQVACVHVANIIARILKMGNPGDNIIQQPNEHVWDVLKFPGKIFSGSMQKFITDYEQSVSILLI